jgi:NAD(P)-dependent dehydrogenase (short-subunit alcohol dehydrogenase family)
MAITEEELTACLATLERSRALDPSDPRFLALERAAAHLRKHAKKQRKAARRVATADHDREVRARASLVSGRSSETDETLRARACYVCKQPYRRVHEVYHLLCPACAELSLTMRSQPLALDGRRVLITGGRVKIGYATALRCLRAGAEVLITTRFPADAAQRFAAEPDAERWRDRLAIHGLDFRRLADVLRAIEAWRAGPALDVLINNAAQTVWVAPEQHAALCEREREALARSFPPNDSVERWTSIDDAPALIAGVDTAIDLRRTHSWVMTLEDLPPVELVETQVVNSIVPALLCSRLEPALRRSSFSDRYIVNVAALEGQFERPGKLARHPHTNMAKAALNMLTRTSAEDYAKRGIYMVSVDPGWVSHEGPPKAQARAREQGFHPPLAYEDAAARIMDPVARGLAGDPVWGVLLKDFGVVPW